jgi:hypothetical protein
VEGALDLLEFFCSFSAATQKLFFIKIGGGGKPAGSVLVTGEGGNRAETYGLPGAAERGGGLGGVGVCMANGPSQNRVSELNILRAIWTR